MMAIGGSRSASAAPIRRDVLDKAGRAPTSATLLPVQSEAAAMFEIADLMGTGHRDDGLPQP